jgi:hypothetical protein
VDDRPGEPRRHRRGLRQPRRSNKKARGFPRASMSIS